MRSLRVLFRILIGLAVIAVGLFFTHRWWTARAAAQATVVPKARVEPAVRGRLIEFISAPGEIVPRTRVQISARVSARIAELPFKEGQPVKAGDLLVRLDAKELEAALRTAEARRSAEEAQLRVSEANVAAAKARIDASNVTLADARRELDRNQKLLASSDVSQAAVDTLQAKVDQLVAETQAATKALSATERGLDVLRHQITAATAEIDRAKDNLSYTTITSPISGTVTRLNAEVGELVVTGTMNNAGTVIMEVADLSAMIVKTRVDENAIAQVGVGQKGKIRMEAYRDRPFTGTVTNIALANYDPSFDRTRSGNSRSTSLDGGKYFEVEVLIDTNGQRIFQGLSADVDIETRQFDDVVKVPTQAVLGRDPGKLPEDLRRALPVSEQAKPTVPVVYRLIDGVAVVTPVKIGASDLTHTVVESGLDPDAPVVVGPYKVLESLEHNAKLEVDPATTRPATTQSTTLPTTSPTNN